MQYNDDIVTDTDEAAKNIDSDMLKLYKELVKE